MPTRGATEHLTAEVARDRLPGTARHAQRVLARLNAVVPHPYPPGSTVVDIGAAQGRFVIGCAQLGYRGIGIEPSDQARAVAAELIASTGVERATVLPGTAEATGLPDNSADVVTCKSVIEHVDDAQVAFNEVYRILRPGGIFWFATSSSRCPRQNEISGFPMFGWYPDRLKRRIMAWVKVNRPELVGGTEHPAIHWFTPAKARRMLRAAGFTAPIWDRWDLRRPEEGGARYQLLLRFAKHSPATKLLADVMVSSCAFAVTK